MIQNKKKLNCALYMCRICDIIKREKKMLIIVMSLLVHI